MVALNKLVAMAVAMLLPRAYGVLSHTRVMASRAMAMGSRRAMSMGSTTSLYDM